MSLIDASSGQSSALLELVGVSRHFAGVKAVDGVSFTVAKGEIHGLIGPNGSGKTTLLNVIGGSLRPTAGTLRFKGTDVTNEAAHRRACAGVARSFQATTNFREMTALHNVMISLFAHGRGQVLEGFFGRHRERKALASLEERAVAALEMMGIGHVSNELAGSLPLGYQRWLGMAVGVALEPDLLLLDEPLSGMNSSERRSTMDGVQRLRESGVTVLLVEHDVKAVLGACDVITVINAGKKIAEGSGQTVRNDPAVIEAYLGTEED